MSLKTSYNSSARSSLQLPSTRTGMEALERKITKELCRKSLAEFFRESWHVIEPLSTKLRDNWHIDTICTNVQSVLEGWRRKRGTPDYRQLVNNLLINISPGTTKSRIVSVCAPAWMWIDSPEFRWICLSGNSKVALRDAIYCRQIIESDWYRKTFEPKWQLADDQNAKGLYSNTIGGFRLSSGLTAGIVGMRGDGIIIDDANDPEEVDSAAVRREVNDKWDLTIANRVNDPESSIRIGIQQRTHEEDWTGHVITKEPDVWEHLVIPSEFDPELVCTGKIGFKDPRTQPGELLDPKRFSVEVLAQEKRRLGSYGYSGQHGQRPAPAIGGLFQKNWWRFWKHDGAPDVCPRPNGCWGGPATVLPEKIEQEIISLDAAFKGNPENDRVAFLVIGKTKGLRFVLDCSVGHKAFGATKTELKRLIAKHPRARRRLIEDKANGSAIIDDLGKELTGLIPVDPKGGKEARAQAVAPEVESGNWYLPDGAPWLDDFVGELGMFPRGKNDDLVDAFTQGALELSEETGLDRLRKLAKL